MIKVDMKSHPNFIVEGDTIADVLMEIEGALREICEFASQELGKDKVDILNLICSGTKDFWEEHNEQSKS